MNKKGEGMVLPDLSRGGVSHATIRVDTVCREDLPEAMGGCVVCPSTIAETYDKYRVVSLGNTARGAHSIVLCPRHCDQTRGEMLEAAQKEGHSLAHQVVKEENFNFTVWRKKHASWVGK